MRCRSVLTKIDALRTGELRSAERGAVQEHLRTCPSCDESFVDLGQLARAVKSLAVAPPRSYRATLGNIESFDRVTTSRGAVWVAFSARGLRMIQPGGSEHEFRSRFARRFGRRLERGTIPAPLRQRVVAAREGRGAGAPMVDLGETTSLEGEVLRLLAKIPRGEVRTYSWLAQQIGRPRAVRAVASVVARNFIPFVLPCHRVVPATGGVGRYAFGGDAKRELLRREGVDVEELEALAKRRIRFIGSRTTGIACVPTCRDARRIRAENRVGFEAARQALKEGYRPCLRCRPFAA